MHGGRSQTPSAIYASSHDGAARRTRQETPAQALWYPWLLFPGGRRAPTRCHALGPQALSPHFLLQGSLYSKPQKIRLPLVHLWGNQVQGGQAAGKGGQGSNSSLHSPEPALSLCQAVCEKCTGYQCLQAPIPDRPSSDHNSTSGQLAFHCP